MHADEPEDASAACNNIDDITAKATETAVTSEWTLPLPPAPTDDAAANSTTPSAAADDDQLGLLTGARSQVSISVATVASAEHAAVHASVAPRYRLMFGVMLGPLLVVLCLHAALSLLHVDDGAWPLPSIALVRWARHLFASSYAPLPPPGSWTPLAADGTSLVVGSCENAYPRARRSPSSEFFPWRPLALHPPASSGAEDARGFFTFSPYGRESNRFLLVQRALWTVLLTGRRAVLLDYDDGRDGEQRWPVPTAHMYDLHAAERSLREAWTAVGRPAAALEEQPEWPLLMSWAQYLQLVLHLPEGAYLPPPTASWSHDLDRFANIQQVEMTCRPPIAAIDAATVNEHLQTPTSSQSSGGDLLLLPGEWLWQHGLDACSRTALAELSGLTPVASDEQWQREVAAPMQTALTLHPAIFAQAKRVIDAIQWPPLAKSRDAVASTPDAAAGLPADPLLALHVRTGDLRGQMDAFPERMTRALELARLWGMDPQRVRTYIATDSDVPAELELMRRTFPRAQIGPLPLASFELSSASASESAAAAASAIDPAAPVLRVLLDKAACVLADRFIGSAGSTYTMVIRQMRAQRGERENDDTNI